MKRRLILWLMGVILPLAAHATNVSGTFKFNGQPFNGTIVFTLNYPASTGTYVNLPVPTGPISIQNGVVPTTILDGNDTMLPSKTYYQADLYDLSNNYITRLAFYISGSTFDLGAAVPTPILTNNISFLDLLGLRSLSVQNLTISNSFQIGTNGPIFSLAGVAQAENVNNILFAYAYNIQNPGSTTCGMQEAVNALPATGGIVILQSGGCTPTTTTTISVPAIILGLGGGGYADSNTYSTTIAGTTLVNNVAGGPLFHVIPSTNATLSGVAFKGFLIKSLTGTADDIQFDSTSSSYITNAKVEDVFTFGAVSNGLNLAGNLNGLAIRDSSFNGSTGSGLAITAPGGDAVTGVTINGSTFDRNTYGLHVASTVASHVDITLSRFDSNTNTGLLVDGAATGNSIKAYLSSFSNNTLRGVDLEGGFGHVLEADNFVSGGVQQYGVYDAAAGSAANQILSLKDNDFAQNTVADLFTGGSAGYVLMYPQISPSNAQFQATSWSIITGTATVLGTFTGATWTTGTQVVLAGFSGFVGCSTFNGTHTLLTGSTSSITFSTSCTGSGTTGNIGQGGMTIVQTTPGTLHYIFASSNTTTSAQTVVDTQTSGFCTTAGTGWAQCPITHTWSTPFADTHYGAHCEGIVAGGTLAMTGLTVIAQSTTTITVQLQNGDASAANAITLSSMTCTGVHP